ncbi:unnamed protein product [Camellia sinensis]
MSGGFSPTNEPLSPTPDLDITLESYYTEYPENYGQFTQMCVDRFLTWQLGLWEESRRRAPVKFVPVYEDQRAKISKLRCLNRRVSRGIGSSHYRTPLAYRRSRTPAASGYRRSYRSRAPFKTQYVHRRYVQNIPRFIKKTKRGVRKLQLYDEQLRDVKFDNKGVTRLLNGIELVLRSLSDEDSQVQIGKQNYWNSRYAEWKMDEAAKKWICWMTGSTEKMADGNLDEISGIEEGSKNSEQLLQEEGSQHEIDSEEVFRIESNDPGRGPVLGIERNDLQNDGDQVLEFGSNDQVLRKESNHNENKGVVRLEFESYDDAYNYYNCNAKELGFAIRVKSSWTKRNSKEKCGAVLCCNCEGFKTIKEASTRRKETRTGCLAMIRLRLVEPNRWKVDEVKLEHNHLFNPERAQNTKSHKKMDAGAKRKLEPSIDVEVRTIRLYPVVDTAGYGSSSEREVSNHVDESEHLKLKKGDAQVIHNYFCHMQLTNPNFFYVMDINDEGHLRHVFWIEPRPRAAYGYFGDVVALDTTCLSSEYEVPLVSFVGVNHHGQSILLGCSLLADETLETYVWLLRTWLTSMLGCPPQTILTDQCKALQTAITEVFPRAHHCLCLSLVMQSILENSGRLQESEEFRTVLGRIVHNSVKVDEFEIAWEDMIQHFGIKDHNWLRTLYEDQERWAPVYSKEIVFAGMFASQAGVLTNLFFDGYVHKETSLKEFFDMNELVLQKKYQKESIDDFESKESIPMLKTRCPYESQLSKVYTKELFLKFHEEVDMMASCLSITQIHANGPIITYMVKERRKMAT